MNHPTNTPTAHAAARPYSPAARAALPANIDHLIAAVANSTWHEEANLHAAQALGFAAPLIDAGETEHAERLTTRAAAEYREAIR